MRRINVVIPKCPEVKPWQEIIDETSASFISWDWKLSKIFHDNVVEKSQKCCKFIGIISDVLKIKNVLIHCYLHFQRKKKGIWMLTVSEKCRISRAKELLNKNNNYFM